VPYPPEPVVAFSPLFSPPRLLAVVQEVPLKRRSGGGGGSNRREHGSGGNGSGEMAAVRFPSNTGARLRPAPRSAVLDRLASTQCALAVPPTPVHRRSERPLLPWEGLVSLGGCSYDECFTDSNCGARTPCLCRSSSTDNSAKCL